MCTPASDVHERLKTEMKHLQRQKLSFTKTSIREFLKLLSVKA